MGMVRVPRRTGTLLVYAGSVGLAATFLACVYLHDILHALRGWYCTSRACTVPAEWTFQQTRDVCLLWLGGLRSVLQIRAGMCMQHDASDRRRALVAYLAVAALDCVLLAAVHELPAWTLAMLAGWPLLVFGLTRSSTVRPLVWEPIELPTARVVNS